MKLVEFLTNYWPYISCGILILLDVLVMIIKKKPSSKDVLMEAVRKCYLKLPFAIQDAEEKCDSGTAKKEYVLEELLSFIEAYCKRELNNAELRMFFNSFSYLIEEVLSTPTKKGGPGREDEEDVQEIE